MSSDNKLYYLQRKDIDEKRWNDCINRASNGLIYAHTFYLDAMCANWDAIILNDYDAVIPLPWRKKWGIKYLFSPPFLPQLGISGKHDEVDYGVLLRLISKRFLYGDIFFNEANAVPDEFPVQKKTNFILQLHRPYEEMERRFSNDLKRNLKRIPTNTLNLIIPQHHHFIVHLFQTEYHSKIKNVDSLQYQQFSSLCSELAERKMLFIRAVADKENNILAGGIFLTDEKRIYNVMNVTTTVGRKTKANHYLLVAVIREFCGTRLIFDFEGSELPGVKEFYLNFRPEYKPYFHYHFNHLPIPLNLLKK